MRLLIDTNRITDMDAGDAEVVHRFEQATELWIPLVVLGELRFGFALGSRQKANEENLQDFLARDSVEILFPDEETTFYYANVNKTLRRRGKPIPTSDMWIAAQALQYNLILDTRDHHFQHVPKLKLVKNLS